MTSRGYSDNVGELTARMRDVLAAAACGRTERETAGELHVSLGTVKAVRAAAVARLGAHNTVEAVAIALRRGEL